MIRMSEALSRKQRALLVVGSIGPLGHLPASGTVTVAVIGLPLYWLSRGLPPVAYVALTVAFAAASVQLHAVGDRILGEKDSRLLVWDELVGFLIATALVPFTWQLAAFAFLCERLVDIAKVPPARWIEDHLPGGWGVVGDDVIAGLYTLAAIHAILRFAPHWVGVIA